MQQRAKVLMNHWRQAVRLPKEFQFATGEVFIRKEGEDVILSPGAGARRQLVRCDRWRRQSYDRRTVGLD